MKLTKDFSLAQATKTCVRTDNFPTAGALDALFVLFTSVIQPLQDAVKTPLHILSAYRSPKVNAVLGASATSSHCRGQACDLVCPGMTNPELAMAVIQAKLDFDQLILEEYTPGIPDSGWVHVSYRGDGKNRFEILTSVREGPRLTLKKGLVP
jgi:hypothetical protein